MVYASLLVAFSALPLAVLAGSYHFPRTGSAFRRHHGPRIPIPRQIQSKTYTLSNMYQGNDFFTQWSFFNQPDPTGGLVNYLSQSDAQNAGLAYVQSNGDFVMAVDSTTQLSPNQNRNSVRIVSNAQFNDGLFIATISAMPFGCSTWPAFWSVGPDWPSGGEIDIIEGVNNNPAFSSNNQMTLHTSDGCTLDTAPSNGTAPPFSGSADNEQCASSGSNNDGCGISDTGSASFGPAFDNAGGGTFAMLWESTGIYIWRFAPGAVPADITGGTPNPSGWGEPAAFWSSNTCDIASHFYQHQLVFDITLCGDWAGAVYGDGDSCPGTCQQAVADPNNFLNAKWIVQSVAVYQ